MTSQIMPQMSACAKFRSMMFGKWLWVWARVSALGVLGSFGAHAATSSGALPSDPIVQAREAHELRRRLALEERLGRRQREKPLHLHIG